MRTGLTLEGNAELDASANKVKTRPDDSWESQGVPKVPERIHECPILHPCLGADELMVYAATMVTAGILMTKPKARSLSVN